MLNTIIIIVSLAVIISIISHKIQTITIHAITAAIALICTYFIYLTYTNPNLKQSYIWAQEFNANLSFSLDALAALFAILITGIGTLIILYSGYYMKNHPQQNRFITFMLLFTAAMLGLVLAGDIITLFVFWELTSITSFLLIGFNHDQIKARRAALQALIITTGGGLSMLAGLLIMGTIAQSWDLNTIINNAEQIKNHTLYPLILTLILGGAFTKSAQIPFHFWLPNAMEAPTPVSAFLHSATMVKAGIYLLLRLNPALGDTPSWSAILVIFGGLTLIITAIEAVRKTDLKRLLAYTTTASLGLLTLLIGLGDPKTLEAAILYLIAHALFKGALFLCAGAIDHQTGTRDINQISGLKQKMPILFAASILATGSMCGLPLFAGFIAKETIYAATLQTEIIALMPFALFALVFGNALMFAAAIAAGITPFTGNLTQMPKNPTEPNPKLWIGPAILGIIGVIFGLNPSLYAHTITAPVIDVIANQTHISDVALWHGITPALILSIITITGGAALFYALFVKKIPNKPLNLLQADPIWDQCLNKTEAVSHTLTQTIQHGFLRYYLMVIFVILALILSIPIIENIYQISFNPFTHALKNAQFYETATIALALVGVCAILAAHTRLDAIIALSVQGFAVALIFLQQGAPDLAFTQFMVETLSVVILTLIMTRLHLNAVDVRNTRERMTDGTVAITIALSTALILLHITAQPLNISLSQFFAENSLPRAYGHNIVNVILVDFRALDTLGEIAVVMMAGIAAIALIRLRARHKQPET